MKDQQDQGRAEIDAHLRQQVKWTSCGEVLSIEHFERRSGAYETVLAEVKEERDRCRHVCQVGLCTQFGRVYIILLHYVNVFIDHTNANRLFIAGLMDISQHLFHHLICEVNVQDYLNSEYIHFPILDESDLLVCKKRHRRLHWKRTNGHFYSLLFFFRKEKSSRRTSDPGVQWFICFGLPNTERFRPQWKVSQ